MSLNPDLVICLLCDANMSPNVSEPQFVNPDLVIRLLCDANMSPNVSEPQFAQLQSRDPSVSLNPHPRD